LGTYGVFIFFGISGILITSRMLEEESTRGRISLKGFYVRRAFRILPPLFLLLIVLAATRLAGLIDLPWYDWLRSLFFCRNYGDFGTNWYTKHIWSLSVEEHFYMLWPAILVLFGRKQALKVSLIGALAICIWRTVRIHWSLLPSLGDFHWTTDTQLDALLLGAAAAILLAGDAFRGATCRILKPAVTISVVLIFACLIAAGMLSANHRYQDLLRDFEMCFICAFLIGTILHPKQPLGRLLELPAIRWIGRLSYSLYLWQQVFIGVDTPRFIQQFPQNVLATFAVAAGSYYLLERPMMAVGHRLARPVSPGRGDLRN
jgi:peptidoglycan/LPS O-acetylase OafA/YrhL